MRLTGTSVPRAARARRRPPEPGAHVELAGRPLAVDDDGRFTIARPNVPRRPLQLVATTPTETPPPAVRVHSSRAGPRGRPRRARDLVRLGGRHLRKGVLDLIEQGRIDAVELDLKDEAGHRRLRRRHPARQAHRRGPEGLRPPRGGRELHERGAWVIGRLVAFRDPIHARAAWDAGRRDEVVQTPDGGPYAGYGGFTNFANPAVRTTTSRSPKAAADAGVDDILYDYVRRPDGPLEHGLPRPAREAGGRDRRLPARVGARARGPDVFVGASVFGVAATRPEEVAQDIPGMARQIDYVAPMLYPSHWGPGEYDVANPNAQPYEIVLRSLRDFERQTRGTGARVVPWLQDFSLGVDYGPAEVRAQIRAARDVGIPDGSLDPLVTYTADGARRGTRAARSSPPPQARATPPAPAAAARGPRGAGRGARERARQSSRDDVPPDPRRRRRRLRPHAGRVPRRAGAPAPGGLPADPGHRPRRGRIDVPAGKTPVVLTFDDSTKEQFAYDAAARSSGTPRSASSSTSPARTRTSSPPGRSSSTASRSPASPRAPEMLRYLAANGFEIGDHTHDHIPLNQKDDAGVQRRSCWAADHQRRGSRAPRGDDGAAARRAAEPGALARRGSWGGESYRHDGVFLVGAEPAPSPFAKGWKPAASRASAPARGRGGEPDYAAGFWLDWLTRTRSGATSRTAIRRRSRSRAGWGRSSNPSRGAGPPYWLPAEHGPRRRYRRRAARLSSARPRLRTCAAAGSEAGLGLRRALPRPRGHSETLSRSLLSARRAPRGRGTHFSRVPQVGPALAEALDALDLSSAIGLTQLE